MVQVRNNSTISQPNLFSIIIRQTKKALRFLSKPLFSVGCGGRIWTYDLQVMSLTSYRAAPPRDKWWCIDTLFLHWCQDKKTNFSKKQRNQDRKYENRHHQPMPKFHFHLLLIKKNQRQSHQQYDCCGDFPMFLFPHAVLPASVVCGWYSPNFRQNKRKCVYFSNRPQKSAASGVLSPDPAKKPPACRRLTTPLTDKWK